MAQHSAAQQPVVRAFKRALRDTNASPKVRKALLEAGIVESGLQNLNYGDRDSVGPLQQRPSQGWRNARDPYKAALDFIRQAQPLAGKYATAGELAQAVQRSAYPGRYQQHSGEAAALLRGGGSYGGSSASKALPQSGDARTQIALSLLGFGGGAHPSTDPVTLALQTVQQRQTPAPPSVSTKTAGGVTTFDGKPVASWIAPILQRARKTGYWKGAVTSGERTRSEQLAAASRYGLQHYPHGPLASNHVYGHGGAVDVSDPQGLKRALRALGNTRLKSAMPEDPVHFSRTGF